MSAFEQKTVRCAITMFLGWAMMENVILCRKPFAEHPVPLSPEEMKKIVDRFMESWPV